MRRLIRSFGMLAFAVGPVSLSCAGALNDATDDAALGSLILSAGILSREFTGDHLSYAVTVPQGIGTFTLTATPRVLVSRLEVRQDKGEPIRLQSGVASPALRVPGAGGWSSVRVRVVAADGATTQEYGLLVTQAAPSTSSGAARGSFVIYSIGDSTMADHDTAASPSQRGWAQLFSKLVVGADVTFVNAAKKGSSSKSFIVDGSWESVRSKLAPGDYVFIQFAHGDEADNGLEGDGGIGTAPFGAYQVSLRRYVDEARAAGATPILFAPVVRGTFLGPSLSPASCHDLTGAGDASIPLTQSLSYVEAMKQVAAAKQCPVVDLTASTKLLVEQLGPIHAQAVVYVGADGTDGTDGTGLQPNGATLFADLAAEELIAQGILAEHLRVSAVLVVSPLALDFGTVSVGSTSDKTVSVTGLSLSPDAGNVIITAPAGFEVSTTAPGTGTFGSSVRLSALGARLSPASLSVRFKPTAGQAYSGTIAVVLDSGETKSIAVSGTGLSVAASATETSVFYSLTDDTSCSTVGLATCCAEKFSSLYVKNYQMPSLTSTTWIPSKPTSTITQRLTVPGDVWPGSETGLVSNRYVEFATSPAAGKTWEVDMISLRVGAASGNSLAYRIQYSKHADFGAPSPLLDSPTNANNTMVLQLFTPGITLFPGETLHVRVFPWYRGPSSSGKYLCLQSLAVHGWAR